MKTLSQDSQCSAEIRTRCLKCKKEVLQFEPTFIVIGCQNHITEHCGRVVMTPALSLEDFGF